MLTGSADKQVIRMASLFLAPPCVFWDVGANTGYITRRLVKASRNTATACAFEPNPELFEVLTRNLAPLRSVRLMPCALGAADGEMTLFVGEYCVMASASKAWTVSSGTPVSSIREYVVPVRSGDSLIRAGEAPAPGLLKIDVEGYEMAVLEGLRDHLAAVRDMAVICEFSPPAMEKAGYQPTDIFRKLWELNFRVWHMEDPGRMSAISTVDEARRFQEHVGGNYVNMFAVKGHARLVSHW
jgi:FkbM family methyltransferase